MDYKKLFSHIPAAMVVLSPDYIILAATDEYLKITMRTREQIVGRHFLLEAFPDKELSYEENPVRASLDKALQSKQVVYLDVIRYDLPKPEAAGGGYDVRYWEASHTPALDEKGNIEFLVQHTSDVTERELAKRALTESEEKFRFMAEAMPQLIFTTDAAGKLTYLNKRWESYTNIPIEELLKDGWQHVIYPDDMPAVAAKWEESFKNGTDMQVELRKRDKEDTYRWHLCRTLPMKDEEGNILMWVGSSTDIHDTRKMVQELLEANEQMATLSDQVQVAYNKAESERKKLERLIMQAPAMFCILKGPEHRFELVNTQYQQLFPKRQLQGLTVVEALPEVIEQGFVQLLDSVYNTGKEFVAEEVLIKLDRQNNGQLQDVYLNFIYQPLYEAEQVAGILVFAYDVTQQVLFRKKLQQLGQA
jgi:PAS domain S-box-containing protein